MARRRQHAPLRVLLNNRLVGHLNRAATGGAIDFKYDENWLSWEYALPVSLSLPLREDAYRGERVFAVFDNLLPDSDALRKRVAEKVGAAVPTPIVFSPPSAMIAPGRYSSSQSVMMVMMTIMESPPPSTVKLSTMMLLNNCSRDSRKPRSG